MAYKVDLDIYNGPMDLLLYLIRRDLKIDIGAPTPKEAEVRIEDSGHKPAQLAEEAAQRIRDAVLTEKIAIARALAERGMRKP